VVFEQYARVFVILQPLSKKSQMLVIFKLIIS
jgi:hypothetical protein